MHALVLTWKKIEPALTEMSGDWHGSYELAGSQG